MTIFPGPAILLVPALLVLIFCYSQFGVGGIENKPSAQADSIETISRTTETTSAVNPCIIAYHQ